MLSRVIYAILVIVGVTILGCERTDRTHELPSTAKQATDPPNIPTNATSPKKIGQ
jgi:hypothetical protein